MNIFESIVSKIFHHSPAEASTQTSVPNSPMASNATPTSTSSASPTVNVDALLTEMAAKNPEKLNWKTSIVDLMKLLNLDSSLASRKQLAQELKYSGDTNDSAQMNVWLSHEVMQKLAQNGGAVPADLKH